MTLRVLVPAAAVAALAVSPAMAHGPDKPDTARQDENGQAKSARGDVRGQDEQGKDERGSDGVRGDSKDGRCGSRGRGRGYLAAGTLASQALTKNADGSYDGTVTVDVKRTNRQARAAQGTTQTYTLDDVKVKFHVPDRDANGTVDAADLRAGDRVKLQGWVAKKTKPADPATTPAVTIKKVSFHQPKAA